MYSKGTVCQINIFEPVHEKTNNLGFNVPPTAKVMWRRDLGL